MKELERKVLRAKVIIEQNPKLKRLYETFVEGMNYSETEALAATLGKRFDESTDLLEAFGGN
jgi:hypothetical protein